MIDGALVSHYLAWFIAALSTLGGVLVVGAFFAMGRAGYRKD